MRDFDRIGQASDGMPVREPAQVEARAMAGAPLLPCILCDQVPGAPDCAGGTWRIVCPICGRAAKGSFEAEARGRWAEMNAKGPKSMSRVLETLDGIESAMCDLEAIRQIPGAMDVWHRWMDDLRELRKLAEEEGGRR